MATKTKKVTPKMLWELTHADSVGRKKDGTFRFTRTFFYRHGGSAELFAERTLATLKAAGINCVIVTCDEFWKQWPATSYWEVIIQVSSTQPFTTTAQPETTA